MKKILALLALFMGFSCTFAKEIALFDSDGEPCAFIDTGDADNTIYLWNGTPVCYLTVKAGYYNVYGFNGQHLGWLESGVLTNHDGYVVGFKKGAINKTTKYEGYKSNKKTKPNKMSRQYEPSRPATKYWFASESLTRFLKKGVGG